jgi:NAD+ diphosphatase
MSSGRLRCCGRTTSPPAAREVEEELGLPVEELHYVRSYPYPQKEMLMLGFWAKVTKADFHTSQEVDDVEWVPFSLALDKLRGGSVAWRLVKETIAFLGREESPTL